jgi:hypothetical protein
LKPVPSTPSPLPAGTAESNVQNETPFDIKALSAAEQKYGFKFRSIPLWFDVSFGLWDLVLMLPSLIWFIQVPTAPGDAQSPKLFQAVVPFFRENLNGASATST